MEKQRVVGLTLILAGVVIPLLLLLYSSGYNRQAGLLTNILNLNVVLWSPHRSAKMDVPDSVEKKAMEYAPGHERQKVSGARIVFPYRFPLAACVLLVFLGIRKLDPWMTGKQQSTPKS